MTLSVDKALKSPGERFPLEVAVSLAPVEFCGDVLELSPVTLTGFMTGVGESVMLEGRLRAQVRTSCARCLEPATFDMDVPFAELFVRQPDPDHPDATVFVGHEVELDDLCVGNIVMNAPMQFLCKPDCKGLCPSCGQNLNKGACACRPNEPHSAFSALKELLNEDKEV